ncbi:MAG: short-chain dehydrogenase, partial [Bacteroidota bacterium]
LVEKSSAGRIINLSSAAQVPVLSDVLSGQSHRSENETYAQSKLALTMWSFQLAQQLSNTSVIAVNPGSLLNTCMVKEAYGRHWAPADKGANILYDLAVLPMYEGVTGKYFDNDAGGFGQAHADAYDAGKVQQLIQETASILAVSLK